MKKFIYLVVFALILVVYRSWFISSVVEGGDLRYIFPAALKGFSLLPHAWSGNLINGLGGNNSPFLVSFYNDALIGYISKYIIADWGLINRATQLFPYLSLAVPNLFIFRKLFKNNIAGFLATFIYFSSTYILMVTGGGQILVAIAYALAPIIFMQFVGAIASFLEGKQGYYLQKLRVVLLAGILFGIQVMVDIRIAYITFFVIVLYFISVSVVELIGDLSKWRNIAITFLVAICAPLGLTLFLNIFWILPTLLTHQNPIEQLGSAYSSVGAVKYFSFAKFENAIALLHPNWPENIFGKVYFMRPEFLLLPILAFVSLFFVNKLKNKQEKIYILFFALLGIIGAFLAKGSNDPFGGIYLWMFNHVPGFIMFRDSTKFYLLIAVSYSILIPFSVWKIYEWLQSHNKFLIFNFQFSVKHKFLNLQNIFVVLVVGYLLFLIRPALLGQLGGTFKTTTIPSEYIKLEQFLSSQDNFSRTLWVPTAQRFGFYSNNHPEIAAQDFFSIYDNKFIQKLSLSEKLLQEASVRYVVVPYDSQGEIFLSDRKYDNKVYLQTVTQVRKISWLMPVSGFGKIAVFAVSDAKDHFYIVGKTLDVRDKKITYQHISPVEYSLSVANAKRGDRVVFAESFDGKWVAEASSFKLKTEKFDGRFNSFVLPKDGDYSLRIYYTPQDYVNIGVIISVGTLIVSLFTLLILLIKKK